MGYSKKLAYEIANANSYDVSEIKTSEFTKDTLGFWWCGRFGMHSWKMPLSENYDLTKYEHVIIVSANWVFKICAPVREFLSVYKEELEKKLTDIYLTHFNTSICQCAYKELNQYINNDVNVHSYQSMYGNLKKR